MLWFFSTIKFLFSIFFSNSLYFAWKVEIIIYIRTSILNVIHTLLSKDVRSIIDEAMIKTYTRPLNIVTLPISIYL